MGGAVFSLFWTSDLRLPSTGACWQWVVLHLCAKWQPLGELTLRSRPWVLYTTVLVPTVNHSQSLPAKETVQDQQVGLSQAPVESLLFLGLSACETLRIF